MNINIHDDLFLEVWGEFLCQCHVSCRGRSQRGLEFWEERVEPKIQPRAQSLTQGLMRHLPKIIESQDHGSPSKWEQGPRRLGEIISTRKPKEQLLNKAFHHFVTGSDLKHYNFNQELLKHMLSISLLISAIRQIINNDKLVETKKELTWWERVNPDETCIRVRERCV